MPHRANCDSLSPKLISSHADRRTFHDWCKRSYRDLVHMCCTTLSDSIINENFRWKTVCNLRFNCLSLLPVDLPVQNNEIVRGLIENSPPNVVVAHQENFVDRNVREKRYSYIFTLSENAWRRRKYVKHEV